MGWLEVGVADNTSDADAINVGRVEHKHLEIDANLVHSESRVFSSYYGSHHIGRKNDKKVVEGRHVARLAMQDGRSPASCRPDCSAAW